MDCRQKRGDVKKINKKQKWFNVDGPEHVNNLQLGPYCNNSHTLYSSFDNGKWIFDSKRLTTFCMEVKKNDWGLNDDKNLTKIYIKLRRFK